MYQHTPNAAGVIRLSDNACIPFDEGNMDYQTYLAWTNEGNTALPSDQPDPSEVARAELDALERETVMNRGLREFLLVSMQDLAQRQSEQMLEQGIEMSPQDILASQSAWVKLVAINEQAIALRARIG